MLNRLLFFVLDVCLLRRGPEDAPSHSYAAAAAVLLNFTFAVWLYRQNGAPTPILPAIQGVVISLVAIKLILTMSNKAERYPQAIFTFFATGFVIGIVFHLSLLPFHNSTDDTAASLLTVLPLLIFMWSFVVDAHIFRRTLDRSFGIGLLFALLIFMLNNLLLDLWYAPVLESAAS